MLSLVTLALLAPLIAAEQSAWGQCGGTGWAGETTCVTGYVCQSSNEWYSQCVPGTAPTGTTTAGPVPTQVVKANYWFSFGDSYTQTGFVPNGTLPSTSNPFGNPPYPGWTSTGGANWIDVCTVTYNRSLIFTYNYAYGGATIDANLVKPYKDGILSLTDQVDQFLTGAGKKPAVTPWTSANALFSIWIGINDIGNSFYLGGDRPAFSDTLLNAEFALVEKLYKAGARNFLFLNVPPIDRSPMMLVQNAESQALIKSVIDTHNSKYAAQIASFKSSHSGVKTWIWDSNVAFGKLLDNPTAYGFKDATSYGETGSFWADNLHPGSPGQVVLGKQIGQDTLGNTIW